MGDLEDSERVRSLARRSLPDLLQKCLAKDCRNPLQRANLLSHEPSCERPCGPGWGVLAVQVKAIPGLHDGVLLFHGEMQLVIAHGSVRFDRGVAQAVLVA